MYIHVHTCTYTRAYTYIHVHKCTYQYIHVHTSTYMYLHVHTCIYMYIHVHTCTYMHMHAHTYIHTYIHTYMHTCIHTYIHTYIPLYLHIYIYIYISYMYIYIHTHIHTYLLTYLHTYIAMVIWPYTGSLSGTAPLRSNFLVVVKMDSRTSTGFFTSQIILQHRAAKVELSQWFRHVPKIHGSQPIHLFRKMLVIFLRIRWLRFAVNRDGGGWWFRFTWNATVDPQHLARREARLRSVCVRPPKGSEVWLSGTRWADGEDLRNDFSISPKLVEISNGMSHVWYIMHII